MKPSFEGPQPLICNSLLHTRFWLVTPENLVRQLHAHQFHYSFTFCVLHYYWGQKRNIVKYGRLEPFMHQMFSFLDKVRGQCRIFRGIEISRMDRAVFSLALGSGVNPLRWGAKNPSLDTKDSLRNSLKTPNRHPRSMFRYWHDQPTHRAAS